ncbi:MAG: glycosyltransferase [Actinobacteria bacterium]|nr:glycosyltransferase [Actinomycetota bacterium]
MVRVLFISRGGQIGGAQRQLYYLANGLDRDRYEPIVVCREEGPFAELLSQKGIETHVLRLCPWRKWPGSVQRFLDGPKLVRFARNKQIKLLHASNLWQSGYVLNVARKLKVPAVLHVRRPRSSWEVRKHRVGQAAGVVAISKRVHANLLDGGVPAEKISTIFDAVDLEEFNPSLREHDLLGDQFPQAGGIRVGIVGGIDKTKRQLDFLRVAQGIANSRQAVTFFIVGEPREAAYYQQIRELATSDGLAERVVFTGRRDDMPLVLASLDVLVTLSGGSVMIEAMACGTPVVSAGFTRVQYSSIVQNGRNGLLVESNRAEDLAAALVRIIEDPSLREQMGRQARRHAEAMFDHNALVSATQELYDRLVVTVSC